MKEIFNEIKIEIPRFLINFIKVLTEPKTFLGKLKEISKHSQEQAITKALIYFSFCNICCMIWQIPIYGEAKILEKSTIIYSFFIPVIFLLFSSVALKFSWKINGYNDAPYLDYFILFSYQGGTLFNIYLFTNFINLSVLKHFDYEKFRQVIEWNYIKNGGINPNDDIFNSMPFLFFAITGFLCLVAVICWFYYSWTLYRELNNATRSKSVIAAIIFTVLMIAVFFVDQAIIGALKPS